MTSLQVALLWHRGLLAPRHLYYDAVRLPALAVGLGLGVRVYGRIDQRSFGRVLIAAMLCGGTARTSWTPCGNSFLPLSEWP
jgi:hypothetical protein